jgi:alkanesulfonate monooxygenase SsuD/methylene tetrahydromethanopterin reductase-like flavin-dependent oxidoreductase (luciferase family)
MPAHPTVPSPAPSPSSFPSGALPAAAPFRPGRTLHLAAAIGGGRLPQDDADHRELAALAERGGLDFVTLELPEPGPGERAGLLDAVGRLARVAAATGRIGLVPAVFAAGAAPFDVAEAVADLEWASRGRAGWMLAVPAAPRRGPRARAGLRPERAEALWRAAADTAAAVRRACGAPAGPRPPQAAPVTVLDATEPAAHAVAARHADLAFVRAVRPEDAGRIRAQVQRLAEEAGRDPRRLLVLADLAVDLGGAEVGPEPGAEIALTSDPAGRVRFRGGPVDLAELIADWQRQGAVDGFHVRPVEPLRDLERFVNGTAALLQHRGLFRSFHPGATLREHLGLHRPVG